MSLRRVAPRRSRLRTPSIGAEPRTCRDSGNSPSVILESRAARRRRSDGHPDRDIRLHLRALETPVLSAVRPRVNSSCTRAVRHRRLNVTFYRMPPSSTFRSWAARVPEGFLFAVKASRYLTHVRRSRSRHRPSSSWSSGRASSDRTSGLSSSSSHRTSSWTWQRSRLPCDAFPAGIRLAVEPRHSSWFVDDIRAPWQNETLRCAWRIDEARSLPCGERPIGPTCGSMRAGLRRDRAMTPAELEGGPSGSKAGGAAPRRASSTSTTTAMPAPCATRACSRRALDRRGVLLASQPVVPDDVLVDPGLFEADAEGRAPSAPVGPRRPSGAPSRR